MKIGIYLINIHHTFLNDFIRILNPDRNEIHLFVSDKIYRLIKELSPEIIDKTKPFLYKGDGLNFYNRKVSKLSRNLNFLVISPNSGRKGIFSHLFLKPKCSYLFIDVLFGDAYFNIYGFFKWDSVSNYFYKLIYKRMMKRSSGLIYSSVPIMKMMDEYINKPKIFFPFNFFHAETYQESSILPRTGKTVFTITGTMEQRRKDLSLFFEALNILNEDINFDFENCQFIMLGGLLSETNQYGKDCILKAKEFNALCKKEIILTFNKVFIDEPEYREWISKTDVILNAINMEQYRYGKFCSGMSESISYCLPGIYPSEYEVLDELNTSSLKFSSAMELAEIIKNITSNKNYLLDLTRNAKLNSQDYSISSYQKKFFSFIEDNVILENKKN